MRVCDRCRGSSDLRTVRMMFDGVGGSAAETVETNELCSECRTQFKLAWRGWAQGKVHCDTVWKKVRSWFLSNNNEWASIRVVADATSCAFLSVNSAFHTPRATHRVEKRLMAGCSRRAEWRLSPEGLK